jgi:hypothetical protein
MTDVAYLCHNCGSVHEVESIRENLILDLRTAASYELPGQQGILDPRARFLRWRMTQGLAHALWPEYAHHPRLARGRRLVPGASPSDCPVPRRAVTSGRIANPQSLHLASRPGDRGRSAVRVSADHRAVRVVAAIYPGACTPPTTRKGVAPSQRHCPPTRSADARSARAPRSKGASRLARLVLALLGIRGPLRRATRIQPGSALRYQ